MLESDSTLTSHSADSCFDPQVYNAMYYTYSEKQYNEDEVDVCAFLRESNHDLFKQGKYH